MTVSARVRSFIPYFLLTPGIAWLLIFFVVPLFYLLRMALSEGSVEQGFEFAWNFSSLGEVFRSNEDGGFRDQLIRSFKYAGVATVLAFLIGYPLAYAIAFRAGRYRNAMLFLVILPFFVTYLIRTLAWKTILSDDGFAVDILQFFHIFEFLRFVGLVPEGDDRLLATPFAVITAITYNFLPFMVLPIYVSLERIDTKLVEAAQDLYAGSIAAFRKVVFPLSLPGVFAGSLLTFIPASGDFINAVLLGNPNTTMLGNVIQSRYLVVLDYPLAAAMSFILMAAILLAVLIYARLLGTEEITG
jgi:spermidine/putrescine transport system permease protein